VGASLPVSHRRKEVSMASKRRCPVFHTKVTKSNLEGFPNTTLTLCRADGSSRDEPVVEGTDIKDCLKKFHDKYPGIHLEFNLMSEDDMSAYN